MKPAEPATPSAEHDDAPWHVRLLGLIGGPAAAAVAVVATHPALGARGGLNAPSAWTLGLLAWMAIWWMTTAVPLAATSLLPVLLLPILGIGGYATNAAPYADNIIFLFAGGAALGLALDRTGVSARFAGAVLRLAGLSPVRIVAGMFAATALVSAWMSNTATSAMMLPVALATIRWAHGAAEQGPDRERGLRNFGIATVLAVAYGASAGGLITLIGSPPNAIAADWLRANGRPMDFLDWMGFSLPVFLVFSPLALLALVWTNPMHGLRFAANARAGAALTAGTTLDRAGWITIGVFAFAATAWVGHQFVPALKGRVTDATVAVAAALILFVVPVGLRPWRSILGAGALRDLPWGVLILFGGGLSLAEAMQRTGLSGSIGESFSGLAALPAPLVVGIVVGTLVFASEIASNTALTATAVPILGALAPALGLPPEKLVIPAAYGASYAFMLPVGTPPNAMAYATGLLPLRRMLRTGVVLNVIGVVVITVLTSMLL